MNKNLAEVLQIYSMGSGDFCARMADYSKPALIGMFADLLTLYINDRNSSTLREALTVAIAGYKHRDAKIGYNGFKTIAGGRTIDCEVKPKNVRAADFADYRESRRKSSPAKLSGGGNFTDYTWARLGKDREQSPNMLVSGFVDGRLLYILEFPFNTESFIAKLEAQLKRRFPDGDREGLYLRGAGFDYRDYIPAARLLYRADDLEGFTPYMTADFYRRLSDKPVEKTR